MQIVAVINYKGGVGKTTLSANLGAELAYRGQSVLLIDLDPQASLTFSFYDDEEWLRRLAPDRTIKNWFDAFVKGGRAQMANLISTPPKVIADLAPTGGRLDLVASHLDLIDIDLDLASMLGTAFRPDRVADDYIRVHRHLVDGLRDAGMPPYDFVLIDCAPNFGMVTRTAIVAADLILIPAKADELSTLGIPTLRRHIEKLTGHFNRMIELQNDPGSYAETIDPVILGVVFTMVGMRDGVPYMALRRSIAKVRRQGLPVFDAMIRETKTAFATAVDERVPVVLGGGRGGPAIADLEAVATEFLARVEGGGK